MTKPRKINQISRDGQAAEFAQGMTVNLDIARADKETRSIPVTISTESPVETYQGKEVLRHTAAAVNLDRANKVGLPLLTSHYGELVGRAKNIILKGKKLVGDLIFSRSQAGVDAFNDAMDGISTDVSVGGSRDKIEKTKDQVTVTRWTPIHVALATVGADPGAGFGRDGSQGDVDKEMYKEQGRKDELARQENIKTLFTRHIKIEGVTDLQAAVIKDGETIERARELLLDHIGSHHEPIKKDPAALIIMGVDEKDKFSLGVTRALSHRLGVASEEDIKDLAQNPFTSYTPVEIARQYLMMGGVNCAGMTRNQIVGDAFTRAAILGTATSSDFPNILADVANKSLLLGYNETEETWQKWCQVGNLSDFKKAHRVNLSEFDNLDEVPEGGEYTHGKFTDLAEMIQLLTYGKLFTITRQALINDDLSALGRIPRGMGRAASRKVGDLAYLVLTSNPVMNQDNIELFHVDHNNVGTPGMPDADTLDEARVAMGLQEGPQKAATLGIRPAFGICSINVETAFRTLMAAQYDPSAVAGTLTPNPVQGMVDVVAEHRLSRDAPGAWYLAAAGTQADTVEVAFLDGNQNPYLEQQEGFTRDGVSHKVRIEAAAAPMDFRGLYYNEGDLTALESLNKLAAAKKRKAKK